VYFEYQNLSLNSRVIVQLTNLKKTIMAYRITEDCAACGTCLPECPVGAISEGDIYKIDPNACIDCGTCADACPMGAIVAGE
jgi:ferredoxin